MEVIRVGDRYEIVTTLQLWAEEIEDHGAELVDAADPNEYAGLRIEVETRVYYRAARLYCNAGLRPAQAVEAGVEAMKDARRTRSKEKRARYEAEANAWQRVHRLLSEIARARPGRRIIEQVNVMKGEHRVEFCRYDADAPGGAAHLAKTYRPGPKSYVRLYRLLNKLVGEGAGIIRVEPWAWWYVPNGVGELVEIGDGDEA